MNSNSDPSSKGTAVIDATEAPTESAADEPIAPASGARIGRFVLVAVLIAGGAFAFGLGPRMKQRAELRADTGELALPTVSVIAPAPAKAGPPLVLSGELRPLIEAPIYARANGYVRRWLVDIGATVTQGQLMAELDTPEIDRELAQARAELAQADAARALAESTAKRWREMLAGKTISSQEADEKFADVELKKATVEAARAKAGRLENLVSFSRITAPFAGTVTARQIDVGQLINEGASNELFRLAQTEKLRVFVRVPQSYARAVAVGQTAELTVPEIPGRKFDGKILRTAGAMDAASRTLLVEIEVDNQKGELLAGSYAQVRLSDARPDAALTLPANTLLFRAEGPQVAVVEEKHATMRVVTLGRDFGASVEILNGVTERDRVVVNPSDSLVSGAEVRISEAPKQP